MRTNSFVLCAKFFRCLYHLCTRGKLFPNVYYVDDTNKIAYLMIFKSATTSMRDVMDQLGSCRVTQRLSDDMIRDYFFFTVIRDPIDRFYSLYQNKVVGNNEAYYLPFFYRGDISTFAKKVALVPDFLADSHFRSQSSIIADAPIGTHIFRLDSLVEMRKWEQTKKLQKLLQHKNKSGASRIPRTDVVLRMCRRRYKRDFSFSQTS